MPYLRTKVEQLQVAVIAVFIVHTYNCNYAIRKLAENYVQFTLHILAMNYV